MILSARPILGHLQVAIDEAYLQPIRAKVVAEQGVELDELGAYELPIEGM